MAALSTSPTPTGQPGVGVSPSRMGHAGVGTLLTLDECFIETEHTTGRRKSKVSFMWDEDSPVHVLSPASRDSPVEEDHNDPSDRHDKTKVSFRYERGSSFRSLDSFDQSPDRGNSSVGSLFSDRICRLKSFRKGDFCAQSVRSGIPIGKGGNSTVYLAMNTDTSELIAVKEFKRTSLSEEDMNQLLQEYELFASFDHPNLVKQYGFEFTAGKINIYMQYVPGGAVSSVISQYKNLHEGIIRMYTWQLLQGLTFLHNNSIVHRDIKPSNMLADVDGTIKLADFGLARLLHTACAHTRNLQGSPPYMSPEACQGVVSFALDIWAVGCTVWEMATGHTPWQELQHMEPLALLWKLGCEKRSPPLDDLKVSDRCRNFLAACFTVDHLARPTCADLLKHPFFQEYHSGRRLSAEFEEVMSPTSSRRCKSIMGWLKKKAHSNRKAAEDEDWDSENKVDKGDSRGQTLLQAMRILHGMPSQRLTLAEREAIAGQRILHRESMDVKALMHDHPPQLHNAAERYINRLASREYLGQSIELTRWSEMPLPVFFTPAYTRMLVVAHDDFGYQPLGKDDLIAGTVPMYWYLILSASPDFLETRTFFHHSYLARVFEHPVLACLRLKLLATSSPHGFTLNTRADESTPILLRGVPRAVELNDQNVSAAAVTHLTESSGSPDVAGLMNGARLCPPGSTSNLAAFSISEELSNVVDKASYTLEIIISGLRTLYCVYMAIRMESLREAINLASQESISPRSSSTQPSKTVQIVVRTGYPLPGPAARQDNMVMTVLLHLIAANMCGIDTIRFQTDSTHALELATEIFDRICLDAGTPLVPLGSLLVRLHDIASHWG